MVVCSTARPASGTWRAPLGGGGDRTTNRNRGGFRGCGFRFRRPAPIDSDRKYLNPQGGDGHRTGLHRRRSHSSVLPADGSRRSAARASPLRCSPTSRLNTQQHRPVAGPGSQERTRSEGNVDTSGRRACRRCRCDTSQSHRLLTVAHLRPCLPLPVGDRLREGGCSRCGAGDRGGCRSSPPGAPLARSRRLACRTSCWLASRSMSATGYLSTTPKAWTVGMASEIAVPRGKRPAGQIAVPDSQVGARRTVNEERPPTSAWRAIALISRAGGSVAGSRKPPS